MTTIVLSDAHGRPDLIQAIIEHAQYSSSSDRLIFAGDAVEIGGDSLGALQLLDELGAQCLVGNHDWGIYTRRPVEGAMLDAAIAEHIGLAMETGAWKLATFADGYLITHAGIGSRSLEELSLEGKPTAESIATALNLVLDRAVKGDREARDFIASADGPLWYRPTIFDPPASGLLQVAGHTPIEIAGGPCEGEDWSERGLLLVDPFVRGWALSGFRGPVPIRYALIEDGAARLVEDSKTLAGPIR